MTQHSSAQSSSSTEPRPGNYTYNGHDGQRRRELRGDRVAHVNEWPTGDANDGHVNDRLACGPVRSDLTTKNHLEVASGTVSQFEQGYYQGYDANVNAGIDPTVSQSMYPQFIELDYPGIDQEVYPKVNQGQGVPKGHDFTQGYGMDQGFLPGPDLGCNGDANRDRDPTSYQKGL